MATISKKDELKIMEMHYVGGIDFPILHEPFWPLPRTKKPEKIACKKSPAPSVGQDRQKIRR